jgi:glycosyltransferase involved in cell wall biosynthesis
MQSLKNKIIYYAEKNFIYFLYLLSEKAGIMVEEKNYQQLIIAIKKIIKSRKFREKIGRQGQERVCKEFNTQKIQKN